MLSTSSNALFVEHTVFSNDKLSFRPKIGHKQQYKHSSSTDIQAHWLCISKVQPCLTLNEKLQNV